MDILIFGLLGLDIIGSLADCIIDTVYPKASGAESYK